MVMGIGLTVLSGRMLEAAREQGEESRWRDPLFVFAVLLIGLPLFGAALYILGWSIEGNHKLSRPAAHEENWLIFALLVLLIAMAARAAWRAYFYSTDGPPWERGHLDRLPQLLGFVMASLVILLVGLMVTLLVIHMSKNRSTTPVLICVGVVSGLTIASVVLRLMSGGNPSPRAAMRSSSEQLKLLRALEGVAGAWTRVEVRAIAELEPALALSAVVWHTPAGMFWRSDDLYALTRYHRWAANHALMPTRALHAHRLSAFAGDWPSSMRGLRITPVSGPRLRLWWRDVWRAHRSTGAPRADESVAERNAQLVAVLPEQLREAGLRLTIS